MQGCDQHPHGRNLRKGRHSETGRIYLITTTTHMRYGWFNDLIHGRHVVRALKQAEENAETLAYVVMPDHLHWLLQLADNRELSEVVRVVKSTSSRTLNQSLDRKGRIWSRGFHDHALRRDEDVKRMARYIIANPLRAGLVQNIGDYSLWDAVWM